MNNLLNYITEHEIVNEVIMTRKNFNETIMLVEGPADYNLWQKYCNPNKCVVIPSYGKNNTLNAISILESKKHVGIVAIIDADFCHFDKDCKNGNNILITDFHDAELMIIMSPAFDRIIKEYYSKRKFDKFMVKFKCSDIRKYLLEKCLPIGLLRWWSNKNKQGLNFKDLKYRTFVEKNSLIINTLKLIQSIKNITHEGIPKINEIQDQLKKIQSDKRFNDLLQLCCGHDVSSIMGIALKHCIGSQNTSIANRENIEKMLRLSYDENYLKSTTLYKDQTKWKNKNVPYEIFNF